MSEFLSSFLLSQPPPPPPPPQVPHPGHPGGGVLRPPGDVPEVEGLQVLLHHNLHQAWLRHTFRSTCTIGICDTILQTL